MEYKTVICQSSLQLTSLEARLNILAEQGWRLHTAVSMDGRIIVIMEKVQITLDRFKSKGE